MEWQSLMMYKVVRIKDQDSEEQGGCSGCGGLNENGSYECLIPSCWNRLRRTRRCGLVGGVKSLGGGL